MILGLGGCSFCQRTVPIVREKEEDPTSHLVCDHHLEWDDYAEPCEGSYLAPQALCRLNPQRWHTVRDGAFFTFKVVRLFFGPQGCGDELTVHEGLSADEAWEIASRLNSRDSDPHFVVFRENDGFSVIERSTFGPDMEGHWDYVHEREVAGRMPHDEAFALKDVLTYLAHPHFQPGWTTAA